ncbi:MAG: substrate-binding domain-containing protein, partial [Proteobacteria bacterium]|nr:substrate-binding domain-containing protein [Pseudomonadota bacterium]
MAERLVHKADSLGIKVFLFNEGFSDKYLLSTGNPVDVYENCVVDLLPNDSLAGYLLAQELIRERRLMTNSDDVSILGITGSPRTTSSEKRTKGLKQAIFEDSAATLLQTAPAYWELEKAEAVTRLAFQRYSDVDIIWSASDQMAEGAYRVIHDQKKNTMTGGIDWATFAFDRVLHDDFSVSVGGHFFDGAWILVLLHDYHNSGKLPLKHYLSNSFAAVTKSNVKNVWELLKENDWDSVDFNG